MIKNVYDIAVVVSNAKRARKWYTEKLARSSRIWAIG